MIRSIALAVLAALAAAPAPAQVLDEKAAARALFPLRGHAVQVHDGLSAQDQKIVRALVPLMAKQLRQPVRYYSAIAWSPGDGLVHDSLQAAMAHHSPQAAAAAAIAACNKLRGSGQPACQVAAWILPRGYKAQPLTMSVDATAAFERSYRKLRGPRAMAISPSSGAWSIAASDAAAVSGCEGTARPGDCRVVIRD